MASTLALDFVYQPVHVAGCEFSSIHIKSSALSRDAWSGTDHVKVDISPINILEKEGIRGSQYQIVRVGGLPHADGSRKTQTVTSKWINLLPTPSCLWQCFCACERESSKLQLDSAMHAAMPRGTECLAISKESVPDARGWDCLLGVSA